MIAPAPETLDLHGAAVLDWLPEEVEAWDWTEPIPTAEWVERHVGIPQRDAAVPGPVDLGLTAYLRGLFDALDDPTIEIITAVFGTQLGKTLFLYASMMALTVQAPGPLLLVMPTEPDAREVAGGQLRNFVLACEPLARLTRPEDLTKEGFKFQTCNWYFAWSNSGASLKRRSCRYVFYDEVEAYPPFVGRESDPINMGDARLRTFRNTTGCKSVRISTPTTRDGLIGKSYESSDKRAFGVPCPHCRSHNVLVWTGGVGWPHREDGHSIEADRIRRENLAWYECCRCGETWNDAQRMDAVRRGRWAREGERIDRRGRIGGEATKPHSRHAGFHVGSLYSPFVRMGQLAADWLEAQGNQQALQAFANQELGEYWEEIDVELKVEPLKGHRGKYAMGTAPVGVQGITCTVDVQRGYFVTECRGWGYALESWILLTRLIETEEQLHAFLSETRFPRVVEAGEPLDPKTHPPLPIHVAGIDARDQTSTVYNMVQDWRDVDLRILMGSDHMAGAAKVRAGRIDNNPKTKRAYEHRMVRYMFEDLYWKDTAARLAQVKEPGPGYLHLPADIGEEWFKQFASERKVIDRRRGKRGRSGRPLKIWQTRSQHTPNHYWDCAVMQMVLTDAVILNLRNLQPAEPSKREDELKVERTGDKPIRTEY